MKDLEPSLRGVTRRRWDVYCLAATLCLAAISLASESNPRAWSAPILGLVLWCFRFSASPARPLREYPPALRRLIAWIAMWLGLHPALMLMRILCRTPDWILLSV